MASDDPMSQAYAYCGTLCRDHDRDRWLATLFAPAEARRHLLALYAFSYEIARLPEIVREPAAGEIRLQWWREAIGGARREEASGSPVAIAVGDTVETYRLPLKAFDDLIAARAFDLYHDPMPDLAAFETYCGETASLIFRLAGLILGQGDRGGAEAAGHAGLAYATVGLLRAFPFASARGHMYLPLDVFDKHGVSREDVMARRDGPRLRAALGEMRALARDHYDKALAAKWPDAIAAAFLPLALVPLYLKRMERADYRPFETPVDAPQWRRQWALWRAARRF